jgi:polysaccharide export outer membrane protein
MALADWLSTHRDDPFFPEEAVVQKRFTMFCCLALSGLLSLVEFAPGFAYAAQDPGTKSTPDSTKGGKDAAKNNPAPAADGAAVAPALPGYRIGAEDELGISVWHEPELSQNVTVRPDGMITLPLLNDVKVVGLTTEEMQVLLTEKLKTVVNDPQVTVSVRAVHSRKVFLVGSVARQGVYPLDASKTVMELLVEAGGLGPFAKKGSIYVLRTENGKQTKIPFDYKKALSGKGSLIELKPGDMVVVP